MRTSQLDAILTALLDSGKWERTERDRNCYFYAAAREAPVLKRIGVEEPYHLSLWTENRYCLSVDDDQKIEVPDIFAWVPVLVQEEFHPDPEKLRYGPRLLTKTEGVRFLAPNLARSTEQKTSIFIPTIPRMLDALLDQARWLKENSAVEGSERGPRIQAEYLYRYLFLEEVHQKEKLLPKLAPWNRDEVRERLERYKRKPRTILVEGKLKTIPNGRAGLDQ